MCYLAVVRYGAFVAESHHQFAQYAVGVDALTTRWPNQTDRQALNGLSIPRNPLASPLTSRFMLRAK